MSKSLTGRTVSFILRELIGELLFFPVWWYTRGLVLAWRRLVKQWVRMYGRLGLRFLLANMNKPMYGDYTRSGRVISFFFRVLLVLWSVLVLAGWGGITLILFLIWVLAPAATVAMLIYQIIPDA